MITAFTTEVSGEPGPGQPIQERHLRVPLDDFHGTATFVAQVDRVIPDEEQVLAIRLLRDAPALISGTSARVSLSLQAEGKTHDWDAPVWFCEPWPFSFQLLGLDGFLRYFRITLSAYEEWLECIPESPSY
jgi:hypothetical protein